MGVGAQKHSPVGTVPLAGPQAWRTWGPLPPTSFLHLSPSSRALRLRTQGTGLTVSHGETGEESPGLRSVTQGPRPLWVGRRDGPRQALSAQRPLPPFSGPRAPQPARGQGGSRFPRDLVLSTTLLVSSPQMPGAHTGAFWTHLSLNSPPARRVSSTPRLCPNPGHRRLLHLAGHQCFLPSPLYPAPTVLPKSARGAFLKVGHRCAWVA